MAGGSVEWSCLTRAPRVGRREARGRRRRVKEAELRHEPCLRRRPRPSEFRRQLPRKLAAPKVDLPPVQDCTTGTPSAGSRTKSPEERRGGEGSSITWSLGADSRDSAFCTLLTSFSVSDGDTSPAASSG